MRVRWLSIPALLLALASISAAAKERISILDFARSDPAIRKLVTESEIQYLTQQIRDVATTMVDPSRYEVMTRENILVMLPPGKKDLSECEGQCEVETARNLGSRWHVVGDVRKVGSQLALSVRLYDVVGGAQLGGVRVMGPDVDALVNGVTPKATSLLSRIPGLNAQASEASDDGTPPSSRSTSSKASVPDEVGTIVTLSAKGGAATFSLDGKPVCKDQETCQQELSNGKHVVKVTRTGYRDTAFSIAVPRGENQYSIGLSPKLGVLTIRAQDEATGQVLGAEIVVDGMVVGKTPKSISIPLQTQRITLRAPGYAEVAMSERPSREGDKVSVVAKLTPDRPYAAQALRPPPGDATAIVAGVAATGITKGQVEKLIEPMKAQITQQAKQSGQTFDSVAQPLRRQACAQLLVQAVVDAEATRLKLVPDAYKVDSVYKAVTAQFRDSASLMAALAQNGDNPASLKEKIGRQLRANELLEKALADSLKIPHARIDSYFQANKDKFSSVGQVRGRHILLLVKSPTDSAKVHAEIEAIYGKLSNDLSQFATLAKAKSEDPGSKDKGGDLGWFDPKDMVPEFAAAARTLQPGTISKPIRTQFGWHIVQVQERKTGNPPTLDSVKTQIRDILKSQVAERVVPAYYRKLLKAHNLKYFEESYKEPTLVENP